MGTTWETLGFVLRTLSSHPAPRTARNITGSVNSLFLSEYIAGNPPTGSGNSWGMVHSLFLSEYISGNPPTGSGNSWGMVLRKQCIPEFYMNLMEDHGSISGKAYFLETFLKFFSRNFRNMMGRGKGILGTM
jgi:hypothetical protein